MLSPQLPSLSHHFGLRPADIDDMTITEISHYMEALRHIREANS